MKNICFLLFVFILLIEWSCVKENVTTSSTAQIRFSEDTLHFDTVFTQIGSATRLVKIFNKESADIILSEVSMENVGSSSFRINVDGLEGPIVKEVRIPANDSIYVFVEVTVDPDQPLSVSPFVIEEYLVCKYNDTEERLLIDAWGQNANYIPNRFNRTRVFRLDCGGGTVFWDDPKPYVIYGILLVDSCALNILAGTRVHVHGGIGRTIDTAGRVQFFNDGNIIIGPEGSITTLGTASNPVVFEGDRLESQFENTSGQWNGIRMLPTSKGSRFRGAIVRNSVFGIYADSACQVELDRSVIANTSSAGLFGFHVDQVKISNTLFYGNGTNAITASFGGDYQVDYTTIANFNNDREGVFLSNNFCYDFPECENWPVNALSASFVNCVVTGSNQDELWLSQREGADMSVFFDHSLIRVDELLEADRYPSFLLNNTNETLNRSRTDSLFADISEGNYRPDTLSVLERRARPLNNVLRDLDNNPRDRSQPDIGCYEYQY